MVPLLTLFDSIVALCNTVPRGNSIQNPIDIGSEACQSPHSGQIVRVILDGNLKSVHVNFGYYNEDVQLEMKGMGTGFIVVSRSGRFSVIRAFQFGTGPDRPNRDPITITIEGSQFNNMADLQMGSSWNLVYYGWTGINMTNDPGRSVYGHLQTIVNTCPYKAYRVLIASQRGVDNSVQYSEVQFFGYFVN